MPAADQRLLPGLIMDAFDQMTTFRTYAIIPIQRTLSGAHYPAMNWKDIRMELACAPQFPQGSPHRCYLLHLPLGGRGLIDEDLVRATPRHATVRRFWPSQPDLRGHVVKTDDGWAFAYERQDQGVEMLFHMDATPIRIGECITLTEPNGERLRFRVTAVH